MSGWIGLDVGGANLKAADGEGRAVTQGFELWRRSDELSGALRGLCERFPAGRPIALTMTGELADCYATKADGVRSIVEATEAVGAPAVRVATVDDRWLEPTEAIAGPLRVAAANWRVAARFVASLRREARGIWIDVGSTTTDAIPIHGGAVASRGATDTERLLRGELIYTGVRRTPVCAVVDRLPYRGAECPVAAEWFADAGDAWLLIGETEERPNATSTPDGRPRTRGHAVARIARCVCADATEFSAADALAAAERVADRQVDLLANAFGRERPDWAIVSGEGAFLARRALRSRWPRLDAASLAEIVGDQASRSAPAHAAAVLAGREIGALP